MYHDNPLFHKQLDHAYKIFERRNIHLGTADKFLFEQMAIQRIDDFVRDPSLTEDEAILDAIIEIIPDFMKIYSIPVSPY